MPQSPFNTEISRRAKDLRDALGLNQQQCADLAGCSQGSWSRKETGAAGGSWDLEEVVRFLEAAGRLHELEAWCRAALQEATAPSPAQVSLFTPAAPEPGPEPVAPPTHPHRGCSGGPLE